MLVIAGDIDDRDPKMLQCPVYAPYREVCVACQDYHVRIDRRRLETSELEVQIR
jgi:hypothetical protein